jgi:aminoglycoside phosphotransferase (APT) family kinase protein
MTNSEDAKFELLAKRIHPDSKLLRRWKLKGGVSAQVTAIEIERPDGLTQKLVVRRHGPVDLKRNPRIAEDEYRLLQILQAEDLPVPAPCYVDALGEIFPTPCLVVEYIEGDMDFASLDRTSLISQLAVSLARIHDISPGHLDLSFLPRQTEIYARKLGERPARLDESLGEGRIREALEAAWPLPQRNADALLHGDFWPGNTLWRAGRLVSILDWEDALVGDPLEDLANSRLEVLWMFGVEAMRGFTDRYQSVADLDLSDLPYWDLCATLRPASRLSEWAAGEDKEAAMREGHRLFVAQAFERLGL